jgi:riboflavin synthase
MFTGIVEELGQIRRISRGPHSAVLHIQAEAILDDLHIGDSVAVNGICLTVTTLPGDGFIADVMHETLDRTSLASLGVGSYVNLERAMQAGGRFGGHIVSGHIDGTGLIQSIHRDDNALWYTITAGPDILKYVVEKGSITIDGISLTVARVGTDWFSVSLIPHTAAVTVLGMKKAGERVNLEADILGKYVEKLLHPAPEPANKQTSSITMDFLQQHGY